MTTDKQRIISGGTTDDEPVSAPAAPLWRTRVRLKYAGVGHHRLPLVPAKLSLGDGRVHPLLSFAQRGNYLYWRWRGALAQFLCAPESHTLMPRTCTICSHQQRDSIETALVRGASYRVISRQFRVSHDALQRHAKQHIARDLEMAKGNETVKRVVSLIEQIEELRRHTETVMINQDDQHLLLKASARRQKQIGLVARLTGAFQQEKQNEADRELKRRQCEVAIERVMREAGVTRQEAIDSLRAYVPDITNYLN